jgi:hypothetical protein
LSEFVGPFLQVLPELLDELFGPCRPAEYVLLFELWRRAEQFIHHYAKGPDIDSRGIADSPLAASLDILVVLIYLRSNAWKIATDRRQVVIVPCQPEVTELDVDVPCLSVFDENVICFDITMHNRWVAPVQVF